MSNKSHSSILNTNTMHQENSKVTEISEISNGDPSIGNSSSASAIKHPTFTLQQCDNSEGMGHKRPRRDSESDSAKVRRVDLHENEVEATWGGHGLPNQITFNSQPTPPMHSTCNSSTTENDSVPRITSTSQDQNMNDLVISSISSVDLQELLCYIQAGYPRERNRDFDFAQVECNSGKSTIDDVENDLVTHRFH